MFCGLILAVPEMIECSGEEFIKFMILLMFADWFTYCLLGLPRSNDFYSVKAVSLYESIMLRDELLTVLIWLDLFQARFGKFIK
jgi:hypothetical protein